MTGGSTAAPGVAITASAYADGALITRQIRTVGLSTPIVASGSIYSPKFIELAGDAANGVYTESNFFPGDNRPEVQAFVTKFRAKYNEVPGYYAEANYTTAQMVDEAMKQNGGKFPGAEKFIQTMLGMKIDAARGPVAAVTNVARTATESTARTPRRCFTGAPANAGAALPAQNPSATTVASAPKGDPRAVSRNQATGSQKKAAAQAGAAIATR